MQRADFAISRDPANNGYCARKKGWALIAAKDYVQGCKTMKTASPKFIQTPVPAVINRQAADLIRAGYVAQ